MAGRRQTYKNRLRVVLADKEKTNRWLTNQLGVSEMTMSRWTTNKIQPSMSKFVEAVRLLGVKLENLLEDLPQEVSNQ